MTKKKLHTRLAEIKAQQEMLSRICKARSAAEVSDAVMLEADRLKRESDEMKIEIDRAHPYNYKATGYILYDMTKSGPQLLEKTELTPAEVTERNNQFRTHGSSARWIPFFEEVE